MELIQFILYVNNQQKSKNFYINLLQIKPILDVPGMTEFLLKPNVKLGLMPEKGIEKILDNTMPSPGEANGIPRCELYLKVNDPKIYMQRALSNGAKLISKMQTRDWGDIVGYIADLDGHIIALANIK